MFDWGRILRGLVSGENQLAKVGLGWVYSSSEVGLQLVYSWSTVGLQLVHTWCTVGLLFVFVQLSPLLDCFQDGGCVPLVWWWV